MLTQSLLDTLSQVPVFDTLSDGDRRDIAAASRVIHVKAGDLLFRQGDLATAMYIALSAEVDILTVQEGLELPLGVVSRGDYFGEMALVDGSPRSATARGRTEGQLLELPRELCFRLLKQHPRLQRDFLVRLTGHVRSSNYQRLSQLQEQERLQQESELERLRSVSQMVAGVAHEINTPLGIIQNAASFVTEQLSAKRIATLEIDDELRETLTDVSDACLLIQRNISVAARLVTTFKSLSVRHIADPRETVDLLAIIQQVTELYRLQARSSNLTITVRCSLPEAARRWDGFPGQLSQVLLNLITNTDRHAYPAGRGGAAEIELTAAPFTPEKPGFSIHYRDFGVGVPAENLAKIFEPFFTTGRDRGGSGLGLAIVHNLVTTSFGGSVKASSTPGEGVLFQLRFPQVVDERIPA